jgi:LSD1 subclass zinc finger protein
MTDASIATQINCGQCGSLLPVEHGSQFVTCEFCSTTSFVDKARAVFHYALRVTVRENDALSALRRWMAGNETVKGLDEKAQIERPAFEYFPMWMIRVLQGEQERVFLKPAAALSVSELEHMAVPAADLQPYDHNLDATAVLPTVPYETMQQWLLDDHTVQSEAIREVSLLHLPIYTCKYGFDGRRYTAIVDAATSKVFANIFPSKWETPYRAIGAAAFVAYFCAALIPLAGYLLGDGGGLATGLLVYVVVAITLAIPIFVGAAVISAKV